MQTGQQRVYFVRKLRPRKMRRKNLLIDTWVYLALCASSTLIDWNAMIGWTRSEYSEEAHYRSFMQANTKAIPAATDAATWKEATLRTRNQIASVGKTKSLDAKTDFHKVPFVHSSAAGYGYQGHHKGDPGIFSQAVRRATWHVHMFIKNGIHHLRNYTPDIAFVRTQLGMTGSGKTRHVWGRAFHNILIEGICAWPLLELFTRSETTPLFHGFTLAELNQCILSFYLTCKWVMLLDWKCFDAHIQEYEIDEAFDILEERITMPNDFTRSCFEYSRTFVKRKPVIMPRGELYYVYGSVPSGTYWTVLVDDIVNLNRINYLMIKQGFKEKDYKLKVGGDDSMTGGNGRCPDVRKMHLDAKAEGWTLKYPDSRIVSQLDDIKFLGHHSHFGSLSRNRERVLRLALFPEHPVIDPKISYDKLRSLYVDSGQKYKELIHASLWIARTQDIGTEFTAPTRTEIEQDYTYNTSLVN